MSTSADRPPSVAGPLALVGLVALIFVAVLGVWAFRSIADSGPEPARCIVTPEGETYRRSNLVGERDQLQDGEAGDRYSSHSGCLPVDAGAATD